MAVVKVLKVSDEDEIVPVAIPGEKRSKNA
jgi:hypothetical protein